MGMLDFLKRNPEDDYDDFDDDILDDDAIDEGFDGKTEASRPLKSKKPLLRFTKEEEDEVESLPSMANSRFSEDYRAYLFSQAERANENLRRLTEEAYENIRQTADQPLPEGAAAAGFNGLEEIPDDSEPFEEDLPEEEEDAYIPGADEEDAVYHDEFDDGFEDFEEKPDFGEFADDDDADYY